MAEEAIGNFFVAGRIVSLTPWQSSQAGLGLK